MKTVISGVFLALVGCGTSPAPAENPPAATLEQDEALFFDPERNTLEEQWIGRNPVRRKAFEDVDRLTQRPEYRDNRLRTEAELKKFREAGKLGEFGSVK